MNESSAYVFRGDHGNRNVWWVQVHEVGCEPYRIWYSEEMSDDEANWVVDACQAAHDLYNEEINRMGCDFGENLRVSLGYVTRSSRGTCVGSVVLGTKDGRAKRAK